ncbi:MAG: hypothetical protein DWQ07_06910 [Chloroflexi bacterium]|nr:MAG: hypothetical protein DWQ07_06910 [Chloroflexota bacterium]MBL1195569.1 hypothetical protein [Chloroflexota bacterium]NOH12852.1 ABC transporter permease [Chloroflexota bacterium]
MKNIWTIASREYKLYFNTPIAYVIMGFILLVLGLIFTIAVNDVALGGGQSPPSVNAIVHGPLAFMLVFAIPAITMRLISEENREGTIELLQTAPVRDWELAVGKWLGATLFIGTIILITLVFPIILNNLVEPGIDQLMMLSGYLGILLVSMAFIALGVAISSLFTSTVAAFFTAMGINLVLWWLIAIPAQLSSPQFAAIWRYLDFGGHYNNSMARGVIELIDLVYFLSVVVVGLLVASVSLETKRWR